jgi:hypothetical protein
VSVFRGSGVWRTSNWRKKSSSCWLRWLAQYSQFHLFFGCLGVVEFGVVEFGVVEFGVVVFDAVEFDVVIRCWIETAGWESRERGVNCFGAVAPEWLGFAPLGSGLGGVQFRAR